MSDFARKAVHWTQDDVKAAAAVLQRYEWNLDKVLDMARVVSDRTMNWPTLVALLERLDWDHSAAESLLIFVNEFRCLIEEEQLSQEGSEDVGTDTKEERGDSNR